MTSPVTSRRICPCRNVFPAPIACFSCLWIFIQAGAYSCQQKTDQICEGWKRNSRKPQFRPCKIRRIWPDGHWIFGAGNVTYRVRHGPMGTTCQITGCKNDSPPALGEQKLCVLHFTLALETSCGEMRRETALGNTPRSEEHTSELQSQSNLVCRLLLEKKNKQYGSIGSRRRRAAT